MPKISVIITCHNYARFLAQAIDSVLAQTHGEFEIVVVDDGSTDHTQEVLAAYAGHEKVRSIRLEGIGLASAANAGIRLSSGAYVIRLDADDYFDENILLVLSNVLDRHPEYGMVYADYYQVDKHGKILDHVRQPKINDEVKLLDRSALAAGAMYRRSCFDTLGGYNEELRRQEDYDFWIRFIDRFKVHNVQLPLMYYRKHGESMSSVRLHARTEARRYIKHKFVAESRDLQRRKALCVLPVVAANKYKQNLALSMVNGRPLFTYALEQALKVSLFDRVIVDTEDEQIAEEAIRWGAQVPFLRPRRLSNLDVPRLDVLKHLIKSLNEQEGYTPEIILMSYFNYPFIKAESMEETVDSLLIYDCDSVISVREDPQFHWHPAENGLAPVLFERKMLRDQQWTMYEERGGLFALKTTNLATDSFLGRSISFVDVDEWEGLQVNSDLSHWLAEQIAAKSVPERLLSSHSN
ncbi:MAG: glycosyltransferase [Alphaproteobacteria bacterium]|nr:glycosyltransferase [Alphaproteobacteria bacterium]